jgi:hypothetical protein
MAETASQTQGSQRTPRVALLWRGDPQAPAPAPEETRLRLIFAALAERGVAAEPVIYADEVANALETRLPGFDGVLVWVDPLSEGKDRARLDPLLRQLADAGVWVSAHPDVILKIGVKEILHRTRDFGWGADTDLYQAAQDLRDRFPARLAAGGPRVLKQNRGNGGQGVWKVELAALAGAPPTAQAPATVLHAQRGSAPETLALGAFMDRCAAYFANGGCIVDQAFQPRLPEGMIRCYLSEGEVVGFGHQLIKALILPPPEGPSSEAAQPGPRIMHPPDAAPFQDLRRQLESDWVPQLQNSLDIPTAALPALWDADFLYGPKMPDGRDTYVLCEINVSAVAPFPDTAAAKVAETVMRRLARGATRPVTGNDRPRREQSP